MHKLTLCMSLSVYLKHNFTIFLLHKASLSEHNSASKKSFFFLISEVWHHFFLNRKIAMAV